MIWWYDDDLASWIPAPQLPWPQGTLLSNVAWAYAFATTLLGRREGILLDVAGRAGRAASFMPLPFSFPLPRLEKDEDFLDAVRAQLRALGQEQDGKVSMRSSSYTEQGWNDWNVDRSWTGKLKLVDLSWDVLIRKLCTRNLCTFVKQQNLELFSGSQAHAVCSKASAVSLFDFLPDSHFLLWDRRACLM